jgi:hypothetical protein
VCTRVTLKYRRCDVEWISVEDRLPEKINTPGHQRKVFIAAENNGHRPLIISAYWTSTERFLKYPNDFTDRVTHWMPLPAPPKDKSREGEV